MQTTLDPDVKEAPKEEADDMFHLKFAMADVLFCGKPAPPSVKKIDPPSKPNMCGSCYKRYLEIMLERSR